MLVAEKFILTLIKTYDKHPISTYSDKYYPQACHFLKLTHHIHSSFLREALSKGQSNTSRIELNALMSIFHT
jgi:hypothetical protein